MNKNKSKRFILASLMSFIGCAMVACGGAPYPMQDTTPANGQMCRSHEVKSLAQCLEGCQDRTCHQRCVNSIDSNCAGCIGDWMRCARVNGCDATQAGCCDAKYTQCFGQRQAAQAPSGPAPKTAPNNACETGDDCTGGLCIIPTQYASYCSKECRYHSDCPSGQTCQYFADNDILACAYQ